MVGSSIVISMVLVGTEAVRLRCRGPNCRRGHRRSGTPSSRTSYSAGLRDRWASPHRCRALSHAPERFLVVELEQGLTNQRLAIATYHLLAAATNRTLTLDDFRAGNNHYCRRPSTASACTAKIPFEALFDVNIFAERLPATLLLGGTAFALALGIYPPGESCPVGHIYIVSRGAALFAARPYLPGGHDRHWSELVAPVCGWYSPAAHLWRSR